MNQQNINHDSSAKLQHHTYRQIHADLDRSINKLTLLDSDSSDNSRKDSKITGFDYLIHKKPVQQFSLANIDHPKNKYISRIYKSLDSKRTAFSVLSNCSPRSPHHTQIQSLPNPKQKKNIDLRSLISKVKKSKLPTNASRNMLLSVNHKESMRHQATKTYELIRDQRRKADQIRHIIILGRVMGQNYRKQLKKIQVRRKIFLRGVDKNESSIC